MVWIKLGMRKIPGFLLILLIFITPTFTSGCVSLDQPERDTTITPADSPEIPKRGFFMGVLPVPADGQSFEEAYSQASQYAEFAPVWGKPSPFYRFADDLSGGWGREFVDGNIRGNGMFPIVHVSFIGWNMSLITPPGMEDATLSDPEWRAAYKEAVLDVVRASRPLYLSIGNEVNRWYERYGVGEDNPNGFQHYVSLYEEIYDAVKEISPETKVFCTFAREILPETREANLEVLSMFDPEKVDILVFTSYPFAVRGINRPSDIPDDYYSKALVYLSNKPFGFSEIGWPSADAFGGEEAQAEFILQAVERLTREQGIDLRLFGWPWLHDLSEKDTIGLIKRDGTEKLAYQVWKNVSTS